MVMLMGDESMAEAKRPVRTMSDLGPRKSIRKNDGTLSTTPIDGAVRRPTPARPARVAPATRTGQPAAVVAKQTAPTLEVVEFEDNHPKPDENVVVAAGTPLPAAAPVKARKKAGSTSAATMADQSFAEAINGSRGGSGFKAFMQFMLGLLIIVGVAAAIVMLYVKYYQVMP